jgi:hypothetical protein
MKFHYKSVNLILVSFLFVLWVYHAIEIYVWLKWRGNTDELPLNLRYVHIPRLAEHSNIKHLKPSAHCVYYKA